MLAAFSILISALLVLGVLDAGIQSTTIVVTREHVDSVLYAAQDLELAQVAPPDAEDLATLSNASQRASGGGASEHRTVLLGVVERGSGPEIVWQRDISGAGETTLDLPQASPLQPGETVELLVWTDYHSNALMIPACPGGPCTMRARG